MALSRRDWKAHFGRVSSLGAHQNGHRTPREPQSVYFITNNYLTDNYASKTVRRILG